MRSPKCAECAYVRYVRNRDGLVSLCTNNVCSPTCMLELTAVVRGTLRESVLLPNSYCGPQGRYFVAAQPELPIPL